LAGEGAGPPSIAVPNASWQPAHWQPEFVSCSARMLVQTKPGMRLPNSSKTRNF
jgi:hypothetical protein